MILEAMMITASMVSGIAEMEMPTPEELAGRLPTLEAQSEASTPLPTQSSVEVTAEERDLLARMAYSEAGNQGVYGMRLCVACALNRLEDGRFPKSVSGVLYQKNQFSVASRASEEAYEAVDAELKERSNSEILYFRAGAYHNFGTPVMQHGAHYFSK